MRGKYLAYTIIGMLMLAGVTAAPRLTNVDLGPNPIVESGYMSVEYTLRGNEPLGMVATHIKLGDEVNWRVSELVFSNEYKFTDYFPIPYDYAGQHEFTLKVETENYFPNIIEDDIEVVARYEVERVPSTPKRIYVDDEERTRLRVVSMSGEGLNIYVDPEVPNVARGEWIYWPITLVNNEDYPITTTMGVEGVRDWGSYRIDPTPTITLNPGEASQVYIYMSIDDDAYLGLRGFTITAEHDGILETRNVSLAVLEPADKGANWLGWGLIALAIILVLIGALLLIRKRDGGEEDEDLITYY